MRCNKVRTVFPRWLDKDEILHFWALIRGNKRDQREGWKRSLFGYESHSEGKRSGVCAITAFEVLEQLLNRIKK